MSMTRKDYEALASDIKVLRLSTAIDIKRMVEFDQWVSIVALRLKNDNPNFDLERFIAATK